MKNISTGILFVCLFAVTVAVCAETNKPAATPIKDYGRGFAKFYKLGLPDAKGGQYVNFSFRGGRPQQQMMQRHYMGGVQLKGNGWLMAPDGTNSPYRYISNTGEFDIYDYKVVAKEQRERRTAAMKKAKASGRTAPMIFNPSDDKTSGTWRDVDPTKDAKKLISFLDKKGSEESFKYQLAQMAGPLFFQAAHFHRNGYTNEANQIVDRLFTLAEDRREVIIGALNTLADSQFDKTTQTFFESLDWTAYQQNLLSLMTRFRSGWKKAPAVKRLYMVLQDRSQTSEPPVIAGDNLTEEDQALARDLCAMTIKDAQRQSYSYNQSGWYDRSLWVLTPPEDPEDSTSEEDNEPEPVQSNIIERIRMRGFESVPLLLAMLEDDYLLNISKKELRGGMYYSSSYYSSSSGDMSEERITQMYNQMHRPATRGEIARSLLQQLPPQDDNQRQRSSGEDDTEEFIETCLEWYEANKEKSSLEMARGYLAEGSRQQRSSALQFLSTFGADADFAIVEKTFLEGERYEYSQMITQYVQSRGEKATAFVTQYTNLLMEAASEDDGNAEWAKRTIKQLEQVVSAGSVEDIVESIISGEKKFSEMQNILRNRIWQTENPNEIMSTLLAAASKVPDAQDSNSLIGMLMTFQHYQSMNQGGRSTKKLPALDAHTELWKVLLADTRPVLDYRFRGDGATIADSTALTIETLYAADMGVALNQALVLGGRILPLIRKRASQRLAGTAVAELPALPSSDTVSEEDLDGIVAGIEKSEDLPSTLSRLSMDALLALREPFATQSNLWSKTASVAQRIERVEVDESLRELLPELPGWKGKRVQSDMLNALISNGLKIAESGNPAEVKLTRHVAFSGITITATLIDTNQSRYSGWSHYLRNEDEEGRARVNVSMTIPGKSQGAQWFSETSVSTDSDADAAIDAEGDDDLLDEFEDELEDDSERSADTSKQQVRDAIELFCGPGCDVYPSASFRVIAIPAPAAKSK